jgi:uncharacterized protein YegP (UPF0339 family)
MTAKYQLYKDKAGKFRFRLIAENNRTVAVGEAYERHASCLNGIESVRKNSGAPIEDTTVDGQKIPFPKYQIYTDKNGEFRFNLSASNGEIIAASEGYTSKEGCLNGIEAVQRIGNAEIEDLTVNQKPEETANSQEAEPVQTQPEPKIEPAPVAQPTPVIEEPPRSDEIPVAPKAVSRVSLALLIVGLLIGVILLIFGFGFANLGAVFGTSDVVATSITLLAGEIVLGVSLILFFAKK